MHQFHGFGDLRLNARQRNSEQTLWPSFTDIMTVIMMVFMLTMVIVILKNAQLLDRVRLMQQSQREAETQLEEGLAAMGELRALNIDLEDQLRAKEMEIILLSDELEASESSMDAKLVIIDRLEEEADELRANIRLIRLDLEEKEDAVDTAEERLAALVAENRNRENDLRRQIEELLRRLEENELALVTLSDEKSDLELSLARQRREFSNLEDKYLKLIRPARSAAGKLVVTVQYFRKEGVLLYLIKDVGSEELEQLPLAQLHRRLTELKARHGEDLYVKIVIPDDSGLSYNEAWDFTKEILSRYDYYYIDGWPGE